jgi:hypothetical protein
VSKRRERFECPNCGADVAVGAKVCRACGSDDSTGWKSSEEIDYQSIDIPDGYGPDDEAEARPRSARWMQLVALALAALFAAWTLGLL